MSDSGTGRQPAGGRRRRGRVVLRLVVVVVAAAIAGAAVLVAAARLSGAPAVFLLAGVVGFVGLAAGGTWLVTRPLPDRRTPMRLAGLVVAVVVAVTSVAVLLPARDSSRAVPVSGQQYWSLSTGSRIRYVRVAAPGKPRPDPVVFLHGGPGTADLGADVAFFGALAAAGFDVYVYDQLGSGGSSRLADPRAYTVQRDVTDLEQIRRRIGADRLVLIGHSYGARVAAGYLAAYPDRVERLVVSSPHPLDPRDTSGGNLTSRLDWSQRLRLYGLLLQPRNLLTYLLLQVNPVAAHRFAGDREMDAQLDRVYAVTEPALHCADGRPKSPPPVGMGFYRLQFFQSAAAAPDPDVRSVLATIDTPVLVVKGSCDYLSWGSATGYVHTMPNSRLVYLHGGHNVYQDDPVDYLAAVRAFLTGRPLPMAPRRDLGVPPDYEGPP